MDRNIFLAFNNDLIKKRGKEIAQLKKELELCQTWSIKNISVSKNLERDDTESWERVWFELWYSDIPIIDFTFRPMVEFRADMEDVPVRSIGPPLDTTERHFEIAENHTRRVRLRDKWFDIRPAGIDEFDVTTAAQRRTNAVLPKSAAMLVFNFVREIVDEYHGHDEKMRANFHKIIDLGLARVGLEDLAQEEHPSKRQKLRKCTK